MSGVRYLSSRDAADPGAEEGEHEGVHNEDVLRGPVRVLVELV